MNFPLFRDLVLFALAVYGAVLSTINWRQAARRDRHNVILKINTVMATYGANLGNAFARVEVTNGGLRPVAITNLTIELPSGRRLARIVPADFPQQDTPLPATLADGETACKHYAYREIADALVRDGSRGKARITPYCESSVGTKYRGEPWEVDPVEFSRM